MAVADLSAYHMLIGWSVALGFIAFVIIVVVIGLGVTDEKLHNPFGPLIRWIDRWQVHRIKMRELGMELTMRKNNPEYTLWLEEKNGVRKP